MLHRLALAAALAALALALAAPLFAAPQASRAKPFPATVSVDNGKITIRKRPARIVSLSPTATETLFAIGAGDQVVAVDDQSTNPKRAPHTSLSGFTPNVEAIAALDPDLVVIAFDPKGLSGALNRLGIPVVFQNAAPTLPAAYRQIRQLGKVTGHAQEANALQRGLGTIPQIQQSGVRGPRRVTLSHLLVELGCPEQRPAELDRIRLVAPEPRGREVVLVRLDRFPRPARRLEGSAEVR